MPTSEAGGTSSSSPWHDGSTPSESSGPASTSAPDASATPTEHGASGETRPADNAGRPAGAPVSPWHDTLGIKSKVGVADLKAKASTAHSKPEAREVLKEFAALRRQVVNKAGGLLIEHRDDPQAQEKIRLARSSAYAEIDAAIADIESDIVGKSGADPYVAPKDTRGTQVRAEVSDAQAFRKLGVDPAHLENASATSRAMHLLGHPNPELDIQALDIGQLEALAGDIKTRHKDAALAFHPDRNAGGAVAAKAMALINDAVDAFNAEIAARTEALAR